MPLPLVGSGGRTARISAAIWPTRWRSAPLTTTSVGVGVVTVMPAGMSILTGCEEPTTRFSLAPAATALSPPPTRLSFFSKPLLTPSTMLLTNWRSVPLIALAWRDSLAGSKRSLPSLLVTFTSTFWGSDSVPPAPLTAIWSSFTDTSTPAGMVTGIFATRDIAVSPPCCGSGHVAQQFATDAGSARLAIGHYALGRGDNGLTQPVHVLRNGIAAFVAPQARAADTLDALDLRP